MSRSRSTIAFLAMTVAAISAGAAAATITPARATVQRAPVTTLAATGRRVAFAAGESPAECHVRLWNVSKTPSTLPVPATPSCTVETSTGSGIAAVSVATRRVIWLAYTGGNTREWSLFTATPESRRATRLRFVARSADAPPPIVLGPGLPDAIPYAVDRELVLRADDGSPRFRIVLDAAARIVAAGRGPGGIAVAVLLDDGRIRLLDADGTPAGDDLTPPGAVRALAVFSAGVATQVGSTVTIAGTNAQREVVLPPGAVMVDAAAGRILYERSGDLGAVALATGTDTLLVDGSPARRVRGQLDAAGLAWARGASVFWRPGPLPG